MPPNDVKGYVKRNKHDLADAGHHETPQRNHDALTLGDSFG
jgi:hypothetical protein